MRFAEFFDELDALRYDGLVGCEYKPRNETQLGLSWFEPHRRAQLLDTRFY